MDDIEVSVHAVLSKYIDALSQANYTITLQTVLIEQLKAEIEQLKGGDCCGENDDNKCT